MNKLLREIILKIIISYDKNPCDGVMNLLPGLLYSIRNTLIVFNMV